MDQKIEVKEEPVWLEGTASTSFDNYILTLDEMHLKEETKSELSEPGQTQDYYGLTSDEEHLKGKTKSDLSEPGQTQPATDINDEISIDEPTVCQLVACLKEEDKITVDKGDSSCRILEQGSDLRCILPLHNVRDILLFWSGEGPIHPVRQLVLCCIECGKTFLEKSHRREHMLTHTGERPHCCSACGKRFGRKGNLNRHLLTHTEVRPYYCSQCGKGFRDKCNLTNHMLSHTGERPLVCEQCGKLFRLKCNLSRHEHMHTAEASKCM